MDDRFIKYSKLYTLIFLFFLAVPVLFALVIATLYGFSKMVSSGPVDLLFELMIISVPSAVFTTAYYIFFTRTRKHTSATVRMISYPLFIIGFSIAVVFLIMDLVSYLHKAQGDVTGFLCYNIFFLSGNVFALFTIALMQAFTTEKEKDWLEKRKDREAIQ